MMPRPATQKITNCLAIVSASSNRYDIHPYTKYDIIGCAVYKVYVKTFASPHIQCTWEKITVFTKQQILQEFELFSVPGGGIGDWLTECTHPDVFDRLGTIDEDPLPLVQLNQLLVFASEAPVDEGFFQYYWLQVPALHPYDARSLPGFDEQFIAANSIISLQHLKWGLYRLYMDALLYFGNVRSAFRSLRDLGVADIQEFFCARRFDTDGIKNRGKPLLPKPIAKDNRYLISEMACKSYGDGPDSESDLRSFLFGAYKGYVGAGFSNPTIKLLLERPIPPQFEGRQVEFAFSADEVINETVASESDLEEKFNRIAGKFFDARQMALANTRHYLSVLSELDVYVATSMRTRDNFRAMADTCESIFDHEVLKDLQLRYFDPTLSAAAGHEDKGLIECLMVKCAKMLLYCAGDRESYGKDAEAAMALSLGKPVIFYCDQERTLRLYRDVHPLTRLIQFETGIAVGAMVTDNLDHVRDLIVRTLENRMEYYLHQPRPGFLELKEKLTNCVVRLQTNDQMLTEAFWNHYHRDQRARRGGVSGM